jgi:HK97 family phage major capsid protein
MSTLQNLDRDKLLSQADAILRKQDFSKADKAKVDSLLALADATGPDAMRMKRARLDALELDSGNPRRREDLSDSKIESEFRDYLIRGKDAVAPENRAQSVSSGSGGGYLAPASFRDDLEVAVRAYDGLFAAAGQWKSETGNAQVVPILNDTVSEASIVAENDLESPEDVSTFDGISFAAVPMYRSGIVRVSRELSQDSYFELSAKLADALVFVLLARSARF